MSIGEHSRTFMEKRRLKSSRSSGRMKVGFISSEFRKSEYSFQNLVKKESVSVGVINKEYGRYNILVPRPGNGNRAGIQVDGLNEF